MLFLRNALAELHVKHVQIAWYRQSTDFVKVEVQISSQGWQGRHCVNVDVDIWKAQEMCSNMVARRCLDFPPPIPSLQL